MPQENITATAAQREAQSAQPSAAAEATVIRVEGMYIDPSAAAPEGDGIVRVDGRFIPYGDGDAITIPNPYGSAAAEGGIGAQYFYPPRLHYAAQTYTAEPYTAPHRDRATPHPSAQPTPTAEPAEDEYTAPTEYPTYERGEPVIDETYTAEAEPDTGMDDGYLEEIDYGARDARYDLEYLAAEPELTDELAGHYEFDHTVGEEEEYLRFLRAYGDEGKPPRKKRKKPELDDTGVDYSVNIDNVEENEALVSARFDYEISEYRADREMLGYTFTTDPYGNEISVRRAAREVDRRVRRRTAALKAEREQSGRYYAAAGDKLTGSLRLRAKNRAKIDSVLARLDFLLAERSEINKQLLTLYSQCAESGADGKIRKRVMRTARGAYRAQKPLAKRVLRMHAPATLKDKIFALMNEKTEAYADIEEAKRLLHRKGCTGATRRELKRRIRERKRDLRRADADIRYFLKRAERHNDKGVADRKQTAWVIFALVGAVLVTAAVFAYGIFGLGWYGIVG